MRPAAGIGNCIEFPRDRLPLYYHHIAGKDSHRAHGLQQAQFGIHADVRLHAQNRGCLLALPQFGIAFAAATL